MLRLASLDGQYVFMALLAALFLGRGALRSVSGRRAVTAAGFSALAALGAAWLIAHGWERLRPYEVHPADVQLFLSPSPDPSFPSDHATAAFAIAIALVLRHRAAGVAALVLAVLVGISRPALGTHYPSDVLAGAALGAAAALLLWTPPLRARLDRLADRAGALYDTIGDRLAGRGSRAAPN